MEGVKILPGRKDQYEALLQDWHKCRRCGLYRFRREIVIGSGDIPADVMFTGEGPGRGEDNVGEPFVGPSGRLLRRAVEKALRRRKLRIYYTNVVACRPCESRRHPNRKPTDIEAWACMPRLERLTAIVRPKQVILLGLVPARLVGHLFPGHRELVHPSSLLRSGGTGAPGYLPFVRSLEDIFDAVEDSRGRTV